MMILTKTVTIHLKKNSNAIKRKSGILKISFSLKEPKKKLGFLSKKKKRSLYSNTRPFLSRILIRQTKSIIRNHCSSNLIW